MKNKFLKVALGLAFVLGASVLPGKAAYAASNDTLTVDCADTLRDVTHCGSGSLYGVIENKPSDNDISNIIAPLNPCVFTNPAKAGWGRQQRIGGAIPVAKRLNGKTSGKVMIRLADLLPGWPYKWTSLDDWKRQVTDIINEKKASGVNNYYGYEIWNEPCYTWKEETNHLSFKQLWKETFDLIRRLDPGAQIIGPSEGYYNHDRMKDFFSFCKQNNCMPDVVCWHELIDISGCATHLKDCRELAKSFGVNNVKISINEYCDSDHNKEGQPASSACYIAKFERYKVDSACISWWFTQAPGRLGSLMASDTQKGAGWWFYKWYGDMSGNMVNVTSSNENGRKVDGFACVDSNKKYISTLLGGDNDGNVNVDIKNLPSFIGDNAKVVVEKVDWVNKDTPVNGTSVVSENSYNVTNRSIHVSIPNTNNSSGYRVYVTDKSNKTDNTPGFKDKYEAENASISNGIIFRNNSASNGAYVGKLDFNDSKNNKYSYIDFKVNVPKAGKYEMAIRYANADKNASIGGLAYNGGAWNKVWYPSTGAWAKFSNVTVNVDLKQGDNIIRLAKGSPWFSGDSGYVEYDYIELKQVN